MPKYASLLVAGLLVPALSSSAARAREPARYPAVVCASARGAIRADLARSACLLELEPVFERASVEVLARAARTRWTAELELRF